MKKYRLTRYGADHIGVCGGDDDSYTFSEIKFRSRELDCAVVIRRNGMVLCDFINETLCPEIINGLAVIAEEIQ